MASAREAAEMALRACAGEEKSDFQRRMLYEECPICLGTGTPIHPDKPVDKDGNCIACKEMRVIVTGITEPQCAYLTELDRLRQQAGISAAMLRDGRAAAFNDLLAALEELNLSMPAGDAPCHKDIFPQSKCGNCTRIAKALAAIAKATGK